MKKKIKYVVLEQADETEAYISYVSTKKEADNYETLDGGNYIVLSIEAYNNLILRGVMG